MVGIKGKRVPGRPGRFDPTEPLHMKTRKATKGPGSNGTDASYDGSPEDITTRRPSNETSSSEPRAGGGMEPPPKRQRTAEPSSNGATFSHYMLDSAILSENERPGSGHHAVDGARHDNDFSPSLSSDGRPNGTMFGSTRAKVIAAMQGIQQSPSDIERSRRISEDRKRKSESIGGDVLRPAASPSRESRQSDGARNDTDTGRGKGKARASPRNKPSARVDEDDEGDDEGNWPQEGAEPTVPAPLDSTFYSVAASPVASQSFEEVPLPAISTDVTPTVTRQASPATPASVAGDVTPARARPKVNVVDMGDTTEEEDNDSEVLAPAQETVEEVAEPVADGDYDVEDGPIRRVAKRRWAGGRKRAAHSNVVVEAAMRRQLELKQLYRQATRAMKQCLGEISQITLDELETNQLEHEQATEHAEVMAALDARLAKRKEQLLDAKRLNKEQLTQRFHAEKDSRTNRCKNFLEDLKDDHLVKLEYNMLRVHRNRLFSAAVPEHETEDEDGIIPRPKQMSYRYKRADAIDLRYDSRSRFTLETERKVQDLQQRTNMFDVLKAYAPEAVAGFTVMNSDARQAAEERKASVAVTDRLADIATEYERLQTAPSPAPPAPPPPALTARDLASLNALADLAARPSLQLKHTSGTQQMSTQALPGQPMPPQSFSQPEPVQGIGYPQQSPRQPALSPMPRQTDLQRAGSEAPSHATSVTRHTPLDQTMGPPPTPLQVTALPLKSPIASQAEILPVPTSMPAARSGEASAGGPFEAKAFGSQNLPHAQLPAGLQQQSLAHQQEGGRHFRAPSLPGAHRDILRTIKNDDIETPPATPPVPNNGGLQQQPAQQGYGQQAQAQQAQQAQALQAQQAQAQQAKVQQFQPLQQQDQQPSAQQAQQQQTQVQPPQVQQPQGRQSQPLPSQSELFKAHKDETSRSETKSEQAQPFPQSLKEEEQESKPGRPWGPWDRPRAQSHTQQWQPQPPHPPHPSPGFQHQGHHPPLGFDPCRQDPYRQPPPPPSYGQRQYTEYEYTQSRYGYPPRDAYHPLHGYPAPREFPPRNEYPPRNNNAPPHDYNSQYNGYGPPQQSPALRRSSLDMMPGHPHYGPAPPQTITPKHHFGGPPPSFPDPLRPLPLSFPGRPASRSDPRPSSSGKDKPGSRRESKHKTNIHERDGRSRRVDKQLKHEQSQLPPAQEAANLPPRRASYEPEGMQRLYGQGMPLPLPHAGHELPPRPEPRPWFAAPPRPTAQPVDHFAYAEEQRRRSGSLGFPPPPPPLPPRDPRDYYYR